MAEYQDVETRVGAMLREQNHLDHPLRTFLPPDPKAVWLYEGLGTTRSYGLMGWKDGPNL